MENFPKRLIEANKAEEKERGPVIDKWLMNKSVIRGLLNVYLAAAPFSSLKRTLTD